MLIRTVAGTVRVITRLRARWMAFGVIILCVQPSTARILLQELPTCVCRSELDPPPLQCVAEQPNALQKTQRTHQPSISTHYEVKHPGTSFYRTSTKNAQGGKEVLWDYRFNIVWNENSFSPEGDPSAVDIIKQCADECDNEASCVEFVVRWWYSQSTSFCYIAVDGKTAEDPADLRYYEAPALPGV